MRLRILHVAPYSEGAWAYGGIPRVVGALSRGLARRGHSVTVCATDVYDASTRLPDFRPAAPSTPFAVTQRIFPNVSNRLAYRQQVFLPVGLRDYLRDHAADFDVAHLHACRNLPCALAAHYLRRAGVPYVVQPNGTAPVIERHQLAKRLFDLVAGRRLLMNASRVLAVSAAERRQLADFGIPSRSVRVIGNPIDLDEFAAPIPRGRFRQRWGLGDEPIVLFLGKITPRKNVDTLVRAFARVAHENARLVIAGNDMGGAAGARALAEELSLNHRTLFTGLLTGWERLEALADADVVVYASQHEIFGLVPFEALLAGTPVVVADDSGCGELVGATGGGAVVPVNDTDALADTIDAVLAQPEAWRERAERAQTFIRASFGADVVCGALEEVYDGLVRHKRPDALGEVRVADDKIGVSVVIPLRNGAKLIGDTLRSVWAQDHQPLEVILVDDGSSDGGIELALACSTGRPLTVLQGHGRGAAAALNVGLRRASHPIVCQIDQDVVLEPGWIAAVIRQFAAADVAAVQGIYVTDGQAPLLARVMGRDLEERYAAIRSETDHVCTGNVAYRLDALRRVGLFDEGLGYGYDNDISYRLRDAGYRLVICSQARSLHRWRESIGGYFWQQYGFGYGRLDLVAKHPRKVGGDAVSPTLMMLHPLILLAAMLTIAAGFAVTHESRALLIIGVSLVMALTAERTVAGIRAARRFHDLTPLWFPLVHLLRDVAWVCAIGTWLARRAAGTRTKPDHSMQQRTSARADARIMADLKVRTTADPCVLLIIPAYNECRNLPTVVEEVRASIPSAQVLVVDDGSSDDTEKVVSALNVRWIRLPERMGIGTAMRVGLRYAVKHGFQVVARLDGDGQHRPDDVTRLIDIVKSGPADIAFGNRRRERRGLSDIAMSLVKRPLDACLTFLIGRPVHDATCGLLAMGPRAVRLLSECHPTGYPEPELRLLISRTSLIAVDVDVDGRPRLKGKTSLTPLRIVRAAARVALAMCVIPLRAGETESTGE